MLVRHEDLVVLGYSSLCLAPSPYMTSDLRNRAALLPNVFKKSGFIIFCSQKNMLLLVISVAFVRD